jgi:hypothetical protein
MSEISEELVTTTWRAMSAMSPAKARKEMGRAAREQPELLAFVMGSLADCGPDAQGLGTYLYFILLTMFKKAAKGRLGPVSARRIEHRLTRNEDRLGRLEAAHPRFFERAAALETKTQPAVVRYLVEAIMEAPEEEDPVELTDEETGTLYLVLKTVIDVLDEEMERVEANG